jgi:hypothetical protein
MRITYLSCWLYLAVAGLFILLIVCNRASTAYRCEFYKSSDIQIIKTVHVRGQTDSLIRIVQGSNFVFRYIREESNKEESSIYTYSFVAVDTAKAFLIDSINAVANKVFASTGGLLPPNVRQIKDLELKGQQVTNGNWKIEGYIEEHKFAAIFTEVKNK